MQTVALLCHLMFFGNFSMFCFGFSSVIIWKILWKIIWIILCSLTKLVAEPVQNWSRKPNLL